MSLVIKNLKSSYTRDVPIWFMRQAGRYMKEYHQVKHKFKVFLDMCKNVDAVVDITMQPIHKFDLDAAIIFSDILIVLECLNLKVDFVPNIGPVVDNKDLSKKINNLTFDNELNELLPVYQSITKVKTELIKKDIPLIGFSGAPWTLATYILEGKVSKDHHNIRKYASENPSSMEKLIKVLTELIFEHLCNQIESGVDVIQIFESHSNSMDYYLAKKYMIDNTSLLTSRLKNRYPEIPIIFFSKSNNFVQEKSFFSNVDGISFGSNFRMKDYEDLIPNKICYQGNLDPIKLMVGGKEMKNTVDLILKDMKDKKFIFNLGHGILPGTPIENVKDVIEQVRQFKR